MALGGGTFTAMNKTLPGAYFNFISAARAAAAETVRGVMAMALPLKWGEDGKVIEVTPKTMGGDTRGILGYSYEAEELAEIREAMRHATKLYLYKMGTGGTFATNTFAIARCKGTRGNDLKIVIQKDVDDNTKYVVQTFLGTAEVDSQTVATMAELVDTDFITWDKTASLAVTAGTSLTGGTDGTVDGAAHTAFLEAIEPYTYNVIACTSEDSTTLALYGAFVKRMRESVGMKCQLVCAGYAADYEGTINCADAELVPWVAGAEAGCGIAEALTNRLYDGELEPEVSYTQAELTAAIKAGKLVLHKVGDDVRVLVDVNSLTTYTDEKGEPFSENQTIRVIDAFATDVGDLFISTYLGIVPNDETGRNSFRGAVMIILDRYVSEGAIAAYDEEALTVTAGPKPGDVVLNFALTVNHVMIRLYGTITVA